MQVLPKQIEIVIEGWFCTRKDYPDLNRLTLDPDVFKRSIRKFSLDELHLMESMDKIVGSVLNPLDVCGVVELKGSLIPFFITKQKAKQLKDLINTYCKRISL
jgi:hypothetical protein